MDRWFNFKCYLCSNSFMARHGAKEGEQGFCYTFKHCSYNSDYDSSYSKNFVCAKCYKEKGMAPKAEEKPKEDESIYISIEDYKLLRFFRNNLLCKALYKMFGDK